MNKYEIRTHKKKEAIIDAALTLFRGNGYVNTSINEIADNSGVSSVSIYNYFGNKEGLVTECTRILMQETNRKAKELLSLNLSFMEKITRAFAICSDSSQQLLGEHFSSDALGDKVLLELYNDSANQIKLEILHDFIENGKSEGFINCSISTQTIMEYMKTIEELQLSWQATDNYREKASELHQLVLFGLIGHEQI